MGDLGGRTKVRTTEGNTILYNYIKSRNIDKNGRVTDPARRRIWPDEIWQIIDADRRGLYLCSLDKIQINQPKQTTLFQ